ncbi:MAG: hypothetical protein ABIS86_16975 [Streptosporangiaceae bacterium]
MTTAFVKASLLADEVREESRGLDPLKTLLTALFLVPFVLGWAVGALWTGVAWSWSAVVVGFRTAQDRKGPST